MVYNIAGVDEAGRGPLAGPVVAAVVLLPAQARIAGVTDSKALSARARAALLPTIQARACQWALGVASVGEIDQYNIRQATLLAMRRAVHTLTHPPDQLYIDGRDCPDKLLFPASPWVKGDQHCHAIAAASIMAKVYRDRYMQQLDHQYPEYGFAQHKGYPTRQHHLALARWGVSVHHRRSFAPVRRYDKVGCAGALATQ